jgi:hypothetical protein
MTFLLVLCFFFSFWGFLYLGKVAYNIHYQINDNVPPDYEIWYTILFMIIWISMWSQILVTFG